jgi:saccharopine dehydrogenase-like NADP-dependent oxidoreductase
MKVALLGAGHIGQTIARLLHTSGDYQVSVLDKNPQYLKVLANEGHCHRARGQRRHGRAWCRTA